jgi:hypothetical protein
VPYISFVGFIQFLPVEDHASFGGNKEVRWIPLDAG